MNDRIFSIRLPEDEYHALKAMAKMEVRTANSWLRSRIVQAARNLNLLDNGQTEGNNADMPQDDLPWECYAEPTEEELDLVSPEA